jgi:hypothetical protein
LHLRRHHRRLRVKKRAKRMKRLHKFSRSSKCRSLRWSLLSRRAMRMTRMMKKVRSTAILPVPSVETRRRLKFRKIRRQNPQRTCRQ